MLSSKKLYFKETGMISPWLVHVLYQIAQLMCVYTPSNYRPRSLLELYTCIESGRKAHNANCSITDSLEAEWDLIRSGDGYSLFFIDAQSRQILIEGNDAEDQLRICIKKKESPIFYAEFLGNNEVHRHCFNERLLTNTTHIALLQFLDKDIMNGQLFEADEKLQILPSYALH